MKKKKKIDKNITIEDLLNQTPSSVNYLMDKGLKVFVCGEPVWGTLEEVAKDSNFSDDDIQKIIDDLNNFG